MQVPSIKKNFVYSTFYQVLNLITPFITAPYIARVLGAEGIGICSYTGSIETYFAMIAALGTAGYGCREIARTRDDLALRSRAFWEIELLSVLSTCTCLLLWGGLVWYYDTYRIYLLVLTVNLGATMLDISWFYEGLEQFKYIVLRNTVVKLVTIVLLFVLIQSPDDLALYMALSAAGIALGNLSMWIKLPSLVERVPWRTLRVQHHFHETLIYFVPTIATSIYTVLDKTLIGLLTADTLQNGWYEQATKLTNMAKAVAFSSINSVMGARVSYLFAQGAVAEIHQRIEHTMDYILFMGFGCCFGIIGIAPWFVPLFFGPGYEPVVDLLYLMAPIIIIIGFSNCLGSLYYTPSGRRAQSARYIIAGSVINLLCNLLLIPRLGAYGAAVGSIVAESVISILYLAHCGSYLCLWQVLHLTWKRAVAALVMFGLIRVLSNGSAPGIVLTVVQILGGAGIYVLCLLALRDQLTGQVLQMVGNKVQILIHR